MRTKQHALKQTIFRYFMFFFPCFPPIQYPFMTDHLIRNFPLRFHSQRTFFYEYNTGFTFNVGSALGELYS